MEDFLDNFFLIAPPMKFQYYRYTIYEVHIEIYIYIYVHMYSIYTFSTHKNKNQFYPFGSDRLFENAWSKGFMT